MNKFFTLLPWILLIAVAGCFYFYTQKDQEPITVDFKPRNTTVPIIDRFTDSSGVNHAVVPADVNMISKGELKAKGRPKNMIDSTALNLKIAATEIQRVTRINTLTQDSLLKATRTIDLLTKRLAFAYSDKFVKLKYTPPISGDSVDAGTFDFAYDADLNITQYQKRKWFLGAKKSYIDISSNDPRTTIMGVNQLTVKQDMPAFGLRLQASGNYNPQSNNLGFGPAVRVDIGRFSVQGNYLYYPSIISPANKWRPGISGNFDLIRF